MLKYWMKNLYKIMTKTVRKDIYLKSMLVILRNSESNTDLPFSPKKMKIDRCEKLKCNLYDKKSCVIHTIALKQALDHELVLEKSTG